MLFLVWLVTQIRRPSYFLVLALIAFLYALPHLLVEVQPRYHVTMTPYMLFGACFSPTRGLTGEWPFRKAVGSGGPSPTRVDCEG